MFVSLAMTRQVETVAPDDTLRFCWEFMQERGFEAVPVRDARTRALVGIVTATDIAGAALEKTDKVDEVTVRDIMSCEMTTISEDEIIEEAARIMYGNDYTALPVTNSKGALTGIVTEADLGRMLIRMMGFTEPGTRITLTVPDRVGMLADIADLVKSCGVSLASIATLTAEDSAVGNVMLRLKTQKPRPVVEKLREAGYRILHVSQEWE